MRYEIRVRGQLDETWAAWFEPLTIHHNVGWDTLLSGDLPDQAALHGVLIKVRDLGLTLISVQEVQQAQR